MNDQLMTLSKIFTDRIFRIPDYQRGYAWTKKEVLDFWNDLLRLSIPKNHYVGVLTLEPVRTEIYNKWIDDIWLISSRKYAPYYVVDGQQRLTTSILLIQAIINTMKKRNISQLNYTSIVDIHRRFISESKDENQSKTYIFSYEVDNPSYDFLIDHVFGASVNEVNADCETTYTLNIKTAIEFFEEQLSNLSIEDLETIYKKLTQHFLFNTYEISSDIDVFVTFETMNNRGKPLSQLELLKNRLIYISTLFDITSDIKSRLRRDINQCWKKIYHILGQGTTKYLPDDEFLDAHFNLYFCDKIDKIRNEMINKGLYYTSYESYTYLLDDYFVASKISEGQLPITTIFDYINSIKNSIDIWNIINNPEKSKYDAETTEYLKKINYILSSSRYALRRHDTVIYMCNRYKILLLACLQQNVGEKNLLKFLKTFEKYLFFQMFVPSEIFNENLQLLSFDVLDIIKKLAKGDMVVSGIKEKIDKLLNILNDESINQQIIKWYSKNGFYENDFLRYFLCEYELHIQNMSKAKIIKLNRDVYFNKAYNSIEHIYPKSARKSYWTNMFADFSQKERSIIRNSLGNFVAISDSKNARLANLPFPEKRDGGQNHIGYKYGTYAEIELSEHEDWGANEILKRGLQLIDFLENRWNYKIGKNKADKINFLGLSFLRNEDKTLVTTNV